MAKKTKNLLTSLSRRGRYGVDVGDLGFTGIPGTVHLPRGASSTVPAIGFAPDWTKSPKHYVDTAKHLASWGFAVVMPGNVGGLIPDQQRYADRLSAAVENLFHARLGHGTVRADPRRLALAGHGMGGGIAALLASQRTDVDAVVSIFPKDTVPAATDGAILCDSSALILSASGGTHAVDAKDLQRAWRGPVLHRRMNKAIESGFVERNPLLNGIGLADPDARTLRAVRPIITGYLLATVAGDDEYTAFTDPEETVKGTSVITDEILDEELDDPLGSAPPLLKVVKRVTGG